MLRRLPDILSDCYFHTTLFTVFWENLWTIMLPWCMKWFKVMLNYHERFNCPTQDDNDSDRDVQSANLN